MHQRELKQMSGPLATIFEWKGQKARFTRLGNKWIFKLEEMTGQQRKEIFNSIPGHAAHGKAHHILTQWWGK